MREAAATSTPPASLLVRWYGTLAAIASLAALQALVLPRWPRAAELRPAPIERALRQAGFQPVALPTLPASRSYELASSATLGYGLPGGLQLRLRRGAVRERRNVQIAFSGRDRPELALRKRQLTVAPPPAASGRVENKPALQTCLVPGAPQANAFGATWEELPLVMDRRAAGARASALRILGLQPNRSYECVLISLRSAGGQPISVPTWHRLLDTLLPALQPGSQHPGSS
jgi:hypothetical protein